MIDYTVLVVVWAISGFLALCGRRSVISGLDEASVQPRLRPETTSESLELAPKTTKTVEPII